MSQAKLNLCPDFLMLQFPVIENQEILGISRGFQNDRKMIYIGINCFYYIGRDEMNISRSAYINLNIFSKHQVSSISHHITVALWSQFDFPNEWTGSHHFTYSMEKWMDDNL